MEELEDDRQISSGSEGEALVVALVVASLRGGVGGLMVIMDAAFVDELCSAACSAALIEFL